MPISKRPSVSTDSECASHAILQGVRSGGIHPRTHPQVGESRRDSQRGTGRWLPLLNVGHQECRETAVGNTAHLVSPRRQISSQRGNNTESEASCSAGRLIV